MQQFELGSSLSWLSCDKRHYFDSQCIKKWLYKTEECPICKAKVDFSNIINPCQ